jgi:hypothetical protein
MSHDKFGCEISIHSRIAALVGMQDVTEVGRKWGAARQGVNARLMAGTETLTYVGTLDYVIGAPIARS